MYGRESTRLTDRENYHIIPKGRRCGAEDCHHGRAGRDDGPVSASSGEQILRHRETPHQHGQVQCA